MKKSKFNSLLYFPTAPAVFRGSDTQPFFLAVLLANLKGSYLRWIGFFIISSIFLFELIFVESQVNIIKVTIFIFFIASVLLLGEMSQKSSTILNGMLMAIIIFFIISKIFSLEWIYTSRDNIDYGFRSLTYTFPEGSYAARFFYFHAVLKILQARKLTYFDICLPLATLSLTGLILTAHLLLLKPNNLIKNAFLGLIILAIILALSQYYYLGRVSVIIENSSNLAEFISTDLSLLRRLAYINTEDGSLIFSSLLSIFINFKVTGLVTCLILFGFFMPNMKNFRDLYIFFTSFLLLSLSDTYLQPFGVLSLAFMMRQK